jgi:bifunctional N-acetylglucosamine-1-phosphate-uridyltransferase/glucosamine-1-phosphate-acetyltransferase GlmU-like protein
MSTYLFGGQDLLFALDRLTNDNAQKEYYITDCPKILRAAGKKILALPVLDPAEALSINNLDELAIVEAVMRGELERPTR